MNNLKWLSKYMRTEYVDEYGVLYSIEELKDKDYKTIETLQTFNWDYESKQRIVRTTKRISNIRTKPKQLDLFNQSNT